LLPATAELGAVFETSRSAPAVSVSVSVEESFEESESFGIATVAVFETETVADGLITALTVYVAVPPARRSTVSLMFPVPEAPQLDPEDAVHVQVTLVRAAGKLSVTVAPVASTPETLEATMV